MSKWACIMILMVMRSNKVKMLVLLIQLLKQVSTSSKQVCHCRTWIWRLEHSMSTSEHGVQFLKERISRNHKTLHQTKQRQAVNICHLRLQHLRVPIISTVVDKRFFLINIGKCSGFLNSNSGLFFYFRNPNCMFSSYLWRKIKFLKHHKFFPELLFS
jgi:hypothetical protein